MSESKTFGENFKITVIKKSKFLPWPPRNMEVVSVISGYLVNLCDLWPIGQISGGMVKVSV